MLPAKSRFFWTSDFREYFLEPDQSETRIACGDHAYKRIGMKCAIVIVDVPEMFPTKFRFIWPSGFRKEDFYKNRPIRTKIACGVYVCYRIGMKCAIVIETLS